MVRAQTYDGVSPARLVTMSYLFDGLNRQTVSIDAHDKRATTLYDLAGNMTGSQDRNGNLTRYEFDALNRQIVTVSPISATHRTISTLDAMDHVVQVENARQKLTTFTYDVLGRLTVTKDALGNLWTTLYDAAGNATVHVDPLGNRTTGVYDALNRRSATVNALLQRTTTLYNPMDRVGATINARGNTARNLYDARHRQLNTVNALGHVAGQTLDTEGNMPTRADALGNTTSFLYDALNRQTVTIDAVGNRTTSLLDATDNVLEVKNALSKITTFQYDLLSRVTLTKDALLNQTNTYYDAMGNVTQVTDARGKITRYSFDALNRLTVTTNADSNTATTYFDPVGNVTGTRDWRGNLTAFEFDALDRQTVVIDADSKRTSTLFDAAGNVTGVQNARGKLTEFIYDALNRQTVVVDAAGGRTTTLYDLAGNVTGVLNARSKLTQYVFDAAERQTVSINPEGQATSSVLDAAGNTDSVTDPLNHTTQYQQDALNRNVVTIDPRLAGYRTSVLFDAVGNVTQITDAQNGYNNVTTFAYDALNRRTRETDPLGVKTWDYDEVGNVTTTTDRIGRRRDFKYDNLNRVTTQIWFTSSTAVETLTYSFDPNSNVTRGARETNSSATHSITYDVLNRATVLDKPYGVRVTNVFDEVSNRTEFRDSFGGIQTNVYDPVDRLTITKFTGNDQTLRFDQGYYETHELKSIHRYTNLTGTALVARTSYILDTRNRLTNIEHRDAVGEGNRFAYYTYSYDNANRLTSEERNATTRSFGYDEASQVTTDGSLSHSYDGTGNRTDTAQHQTGTGNQLTNDGLWTYTYDFEGNLQKKSKGTDMETWWYGYDHQNQLTQVVKRLTHLETGVIRRQVDFKYDAFGQRIEKVHYDDPNGGGTGSTTTTRFAYDGENVFADFDGGTPPSLTTRYLRGDVIDQIFARIGAPGGATELNWLLQDRLGSVREVRNATGVEIANVGYDSFGNVLGSPPAALGRYTWTGRERDVEIDLQYNRARYYDPATGRWIHRDPLGFDAGDSNLYRYVNNGPTNGTDPSGLQYPPPPNPTPGIPLLHPTREEGIAQQAPWFAKGATQTKDGDWILRREDWGKTGKATEFLEDIAARFGNDRVSERAVERYLKESEANPPTRGASGSSVSTPGEPLPSKPTSSSPWTFSGLGPPGFAFGPNQKVLNEWNRQVQIFNQQEGENVRRHHALWYNAVRWLSVMSRLRTDYVGKKSDINLLLEAVEYVENRAIEVTLPGPSPRLSYTRWGYAEPDQFFEYYEKRVEWVGETVSRLMGRQQLHDDFWDGAQFGLHVAMRVPWPGAAVAAGVNTVISAGRAEPIDPSDPDALKKMAGQFMRPSVGLGGPGGGGISSGTIMGSGGIGGGGGGPLRGAGRSFQDRRADFNRDPGRWESVSSHVERATRRGARQSGVSTQTLYRNRDTGATLWRHTVTDDRGRIVDDHFRPYYQPRATDLP